MRDNVQSALNIMIAVIVITTAIICIVLSTIFFSIHTNQIKTEIVNSYQYHYEYCITHVVQSDCHDYAATNIQ